jgi:DNA polymerase III subunit delta
MSGNFPQSSNTPPPAEHLIQILTGQDAFRKRLYLDKLKDRLVKTDEIAFNYSLYNAKDAAASDITNSLETFSISNTNRLIALTEPEALSETDKEILLNYIRKPRTQRTFFIMVADKPSARLDKFLDMLPKEVKRVDLSEIKPVNMHSWIYTEFKKRNKTISRKDIELISEATKKDFGKALAVIEQASLFAGDRENIAEDDINFFLGGAAEPSVSRLLDSINSKASDKALLILKEIITSGTTPVQMIGLLAWRVTNLIKVKKLLALGVPKKEMFSCLKVGSYRLNDLIAQAGGFTLKRLRKDLQDLLNTDLLIKTSGIKDDFLLEMLIVRLAR